MQSVKSDTELASGIIRQNFPSSHLTIPFIGPRQQSSIVQNPISKNNFTNIVEYHRAIHFITSATAT